MGAARLAGSQLPGSNVMASLSEINKQIAALQKQAEAIRKADSKDAITKVKDLIAKHGLTAEDLGYGAGSAAAAPAFVERKKRGPNKKGGAQKAGGKQTVGVPMYRDPVSGKTWTGRGKPPLWIAGAKSRESFLISSQSSSAGESTAAVPTLKKKVKKPNAAPKAAQKASAKLAPKLARKPGRRRAAEAVAAPAAKVARKAVKAKPAKAIKAPKAAVKGARRVGKRGSQVNGSAVPVSTGAETGGAADVSATRS